MNNSAAIQASSRKIIRYNATKVSSQGGFSLIEVLITILILTFGALAIANLQTATLMANASSGDHFRINELSHAIIEQIKADPVRAAAGEYNTEYSDNAATNTNVAYVSEAINAWKMNVSKAIPLGETRIQCDADQCAIGLRWHEVTHDGSSEQTYNSSIPI